MVSIIYMCSTYFVPKFFVGELPYELTSYRGGTLAARKTGSENQHNTTFLHASVKCQVQVKTQDQDANFNIQNAGQREHDEQPWLLRLHQRHSGHARYGLWFRKFGMLIVYI